MDDETPQRREADKYSDPEMATLEQATSEMHKTRHELQSFKDTVTGDVAEALSKAEAANAQSAQNKADATAMEKRFVDDRRRSKWSAVAIFAVLAILLWISWSARNQAEINTQASVDAKHASDDVAALVASFKDCLDPSGSCYKTSQARTAAFLQDLNAKNDERTQKIIDQLNSNEINDQQALVLLCVNAVSRAQMDICSSITTTTTAAPTTTQAPTTTAPPTATTVKATVTTGTAYRTATTSP